MTAPDTPPPPAPEHEVEDARTGPLAKAGLALGPVAFAAALLVPLPVLSRAGVDVGPGTNVRVVLGLALWMCVWWLTEALPLAATSLLPIVVLPVSGVLPAKEVAPTYFDDTITLFLGGFLLALAMERSELHRRIAWRVVRIAGTSPRRLVLGFFAASALLSMWVSNTATALLLMPVATTVVRARLHGPASMRSRGERCFAACCVLAVAYGASLGGVGTLVGTPPNMILKRTYEGATAATGTPDVLSFGHWFLVGAPLVVVLVPLTWWLLVKWVLPVPVALGDGEGDPWLERLRPQGRTSFAQRAVLVLFVATALAWISHQRMEVGGDSVPLTGWDEAFSFGRKTADGRPLSFVTDGTIAVACALLLFTLPGGAVAGERLLPWSYARKRLPWGALLLFGGGFALAAAFQVKDGLNGYLAAAFAGMHHMPEWAVLLVVASGMTLLSEIANNTAATNMMMPVLAAAAKGLGMAPLPIMMVGALAASCGFALPIATMPNTIAYGTGEVSVGQMGRAGIVLDVVATLVMVLAVLFLLPLSR
jgi:sodium-dependent dicarboxylate transporter 2/3/5